MHVFFLCWHIEITLQCVPYVCVFHVLSPYEASSVQHKKPYFPSLFFLECEPAVGNESKTFRFSATLEMYRSDCARPDHIKDE